MNGVRELVEGKRIRQCRAWGKRDQLGESYYSQLGELMSASGHSVNEVEPGDHAYVLSNVAVYLLLFVNREGSFKKQRCGRAEFVDTLMPSDPFSWDYPKPGKEIVLHRFKENWAYFIIETQKKTSKELIDALADEAFQDSKHLEG